MNAANRPRNSDLSINRSGRSSQRGRRTPFVGYIRNRGGFYRSADTARSVRARLRNIPSRMFEDDSSSEGSQASVEPEDPDVDAIIDVDAVAVVDEVRPSSNSASTSALAMAAQRNENSGENSLASTYRNATSSDAQATELAAHVEVNALVPTVSGENVEISNPEHAETSGNAAMLSENIALPAVSENAMANTPSPPKKRKRVGSGTPKTKSTPKLGSADANSEDDSNSVDDGCTCPICFDHWEMSGEHRLVALRCGHLFGESCIRRWLSECGRQSGVKMCPQCKTKATPRDIRYLYAKRVRAIDRTEEHELRKNLEHDRKKLKNVEMELDTLKITYAVTLKKVQEQDLEIERLKNSYRMRSNGMYMEEENTVPSKMYKLFMEKNIVLSQDSGCRVMAYTDKHSSLLVSQKNSNSMFPGFGVRIIDVPSFRATQFIHLTSKMLRDISISADQQIMACTSMEPSAKLYDFRMRTVISIAAPNSDKKLWACALGDAAREHFLYAGGQQGTTYVFDTRYSSNVIAEYETMGDLSPVVSIVVIPKCDNFPLGGFCICKLQSIWFYEYQTTGIAPTRLNIEGPFMSMNYEESLSLLIITARVNTPDTESRYLVGKLQKVQSRPHFELKATLLGSKTTPVMTRSCHISIDSNSLLASYIQDSKQLALFDINRKIRIQSLPIYDVVFDTCPIYTSTDVYVAALTESKCRIYKVNES